MVIQIFIVLFSIFAISRVASRYFRKEMTVFMFITWSLLWIAVLVVAVIPDATSYIANIVGVGRGADLAVYVSIIIIFYLIFRVYGILYRIERQITRIVTHLAVTEEEEKTQK